MSTRRAFGALLWRLGDLIQAAETRRSFRARAYHAAVWALDELDPDLQAERHEVLSIPGIGSGVADLLEEFRRTGTIAQLDRLEDVYPRDTPFLRRLPRMTPEKLRLLKADAGVESVEDLRRAIETGDAQTVRGIGETTLALWAAIIELPPQRAMIPAQRGWVVASQIVGHLRRHTGTNAEIAGPVRRVEEWVAGVDIVAATEDVQRLRAFLSTAAVFRNWLDSRSVFETHSSVRGTIHFASKDSLGTAMVLATGPEDHLIEVFGGDDIPAFPTETEAYAAYGVDLVPPAARHLPMAVASHVVRLDDIRGDLHLHSDWSPDGRMSLETVLDSAVMRGYEYVLITDHTIGLRFGGLDSEGLVAQREYLDKLASAYPHLRVFHGAEVNIDRQGGLDLDDEALEMMDFVVAGLHSHFGLSMAEQTARLVRAVAHPSVKVLAHPTGRRIGIRPAVAADVEVVIAAAIDHGCALECNGHLDRLDLSPSWAGVALDLGARFAANSDAHRAGEIGNIANAVATLQSAGVGPDRVVNTLPLDELTTWLGD